MPGDVLIPAKYASLKYVGVVVVWSGVRVSDELLTVEQYCTSA